MTSSAEQKPSERDTTISSFMDLLCRVRNSIMYVLSWGTVSATTRVLLLYLFPSLLLNSENKHQNNPLVSAETVRHSSTYIILYICRYRDDHVGSYITVKSHEHHSISIHWKINCLCNSLLEMEKNPPHYCPFHKGNPMVTGCWFPTQRASNAESVFHVMMSHIYIYTYRYIMGLVIQHGFQPNSVRKKWWECCCKQFIC